MLKAKCNGAKFLSSLSKECTHIVVFAFVDDTNLITFDMKLDSASQDDIAEKMQQAIDRLKGGLKYTGSAIVPDKSWVQISFTLMTKKEQATYHQEKLILNPQWLMQKGKEFH